MLETLLAGSLFANIIQVLALIFKNRREVRRDTILEYEHLITRYEAQVSRHETQLIAHEKIVRALSQQCNECDLCFMQFYGYVERLYDVSKRLSGHIKDLGGKPEDVPPVPEKPERKQVDVEFMLRTSEQIRVFGKEADDRDRDFREVRRRSNENPSG